MALFDGLSADKSSLGLTAMKFCTDMKGGQSMNPADFGESLDFLLAPPAGQCFNLSHEISHHPLSGSAQNVSCRHSWLPDLEP